MAADNATVAVTISETVYKTNGGSGALATSDFSLSISGGIATMSSATPTSIAASGNVYTLGIGLSGTPDGSEVLTVVPTDDGIYDAVGNESSTTQSNNTANLKDKTAPAIPTGLLATPGSTQAVLAWTANSESDLASYKVYGGTSASPTTLLATIATGTVTYTNTSLTNGTIYFYRISSVDNSSNESSKSSDITILPHDPAGNYGLTFDGTNDYVSVRYSSDLRFADTDAFTIETWVKLASTANSNIISKTDQYFILVANSKFQFKGHFFQENVGNTLGLVQSTTTATTGIWYHLAATFSKSSGKLTLYVNGTQEGQVTGLTDYDITGTTDALIIGAKKYYTLPPDGYVNGAIDEVAIWDEAITAAEITALYNSGAPLAANSDAGDYTSSANLKGHWRFAENSGTTTYDISGNGNHATINGSTFSTPGADAAAPAAPTGLVATPGASQVTLSWTANSESDMASYKVYGGTSASPTTLLATISSGTETSTVSSLTNGSTYYYRISANDNAGNESSKTSDVTSMPHVTDGDYSLSFDGTDDYVDLGNTSALTITGSVTLSAWVSFSNFDNSLAAVISKYSGTNGYSIEKTAGENKLSFWVGDGSDDIEVTSNTLSATTWYHVVGTNDGTTSKIYVNGSLANSTAQGSPVGPTGNLKIGMHSEQTASSRYWNGKIDEVAIWNDALTVAEITALYNSGNPLTASSNSGNYTSAANVKGYWRFGENTGTKVHDLTGSGNHGTISGATYVSPGADAA